MKTKTFLKKLLPLGIGLLFALVMLAFLIPVANALLPDLLPVLRRADQAEIALYVRSLGGWTGAVLMVLLQFLQVISIVLPALPIQLAAGLVYGVLPAFFLCLAGYALANITVFLAANGVLKKLTEALAPGRDSETGMLFRETQHPVVLLFVSYFVPILPKGVLPYAAAQAGIRLRCYLAAMLLGSIPSVFVICLAGQFLLSGNFLWAILLLALFLSVGAVLYFCRKRVTRFAIKHLQLGVCDGAATKETRK